jgi:hypothetical protein
MINVSHEEVQYDSIVVRAGSAAGWVFAAGLAAFGAQIFVIEAGRIDDALTIANPSI